MYYINSQIAELVFRIFNKLAISNEKKLPICDGVCPFLANL